MTSFERKRKSQLGLHFGTASNRLKLTIMFSLVQKLGLDTCFKCSEPIARALDLSVEHKIPWLDNSPDLFWDLDNIAFSHKACNRPDRYNPWNRQILPKGNIKCISCNKSLSEDLFPEVESYKRLVCNKCLKGRFGI